MDKNSLLSYINVMYKDSDNSKRYEASQKLEEFQKSFEAWDVSFELLRSATPSDDVDASSTFAAVTIRTKVERDFLNLSNDMHEQLKGLLIESMIKFHYVNVIRKQLTLALAYFSLQKAEWLNPVEDVFNKLTGKPGRDILTLEFFTVLAEELNSTGHVRIGKNRRDQVYSQLCKVSTQMHEFLVYLLSQENSAHSNMVCPVFECFSAWCEAYTFTEQLLQTSPLIHALFALINDENIDEDDHERHCQCLCNILYVTGSDIGSFRNFLVLLKSNILTCLQPAFDKFIQTDEVKAINVIKVFVEFGMALANIYRLDIPDNELNDLDILNVFLRYTKVNNMEILKLMLSLWIVLCDTIKEMPASSYDKYASYCRDLILVLFEHCILKEENYAASTGYLTTKCRNFRVSIMDLMHSLVPIIGVSNGINLLSSHLNHPQDWQHAETALFFARTFINYLPKDNDDQGFILSILSGILNVDPSSTHPALISTAIEFIGDLNKWLQYHPELTLKVVQFLFKMLPYSIPLTAKSIFSLCYSCSEQLVSLMPMFVNTACSAVQNPNVNQSSVRFLLKSTSLVMIKLNVEQITEVMNRLFDVLIEELRKVLERKDFHEKDVIPKLDNMAAVLRILTEIKLDDVKQHPCYSSFEKAWPYIAKCCQIPHLDVSESCCRVIRFAVRSMRQHFAPMLNFVIGQLLQSFGENGYSSYVYLMSVLVDEFGSDSSFQECLTNLVVGPLTSKVLSILNEKADSCRRNPDLVDDFYRLCKRLLSHCPFPYVYSNEFASTLDLAVRNFSVEHKDALVSILLFTCAVIRVGVVVNKQDNFSRERVNTVKSILETKGINIVNSLFHSLCLSLSESYLDLIADILIEIKCFDENAYVNLVQYALNSLPKYRGDILVMKEQQVQDFAGKLKEVKSTRDLFYVLKALREIYH